MKKIVNNNIIIMDDRFWIKDENNNIIKEVLFEKLDSIDEDKDRIFIEYYNSDEKITITLPEFKNKKEFNSTLQQLQNGYNVWEEMVAAMDMITMSKIGFMRIEPDYAKRKIVIFL